MKLRISLSARAEIRDAMRYYNRRQPGLGAEFRDEIYRAFARVVENPLAWPVILADARRIIARRFPYCVYFKMTEDEIVVLAVAHQSRDPAHWRDKFWQA